MNTFSESTNQQSADDVSEQPAAEPQNPNASSSSELPQPIEGSHAIEPLDPHQTAAETAALAAHLQRAGVMWLPRPDVQSTELFVTRFSVPDTLLPTSSGTSTGEPNSTQLGVGQTGAGTGSSGNVAPANDHAGTSATGTSATGTSATGTSATGTSATRVNNSSGPKPPPTRDTPNRPPASRPASRLEGVSAIHATAGDYPSDALPPEQRTLQLTQLEEAVASCTQCAALANCRNKTVFGEGNTSPRIAFFGEGPGEEEDLSGRPFVGRAGELLTKMIEACTLQRDDVYILNTIKCRPPGNRNPEGDEIANCRSYYQQQFDLLRPEYIVCLGAVSAQELLGTKLSVGRLRGTLHRYFASKVLVTYHPAYLLRNPAAKKAAWADLQLLMRDACIQIPKR